MDGQAVKWNIKTDYSETAKELANSCNISTVLAQLLVNRGVTTPEQVADFLNPSFDSLHSPWLLPDMKQAVELIDKIIKSNEPILIYGDYDADGVTATALLYEYLSTKFDNIYYYIPDRFKDGYGLTNAGVNSVLERFPQCKLIITVDCGINSIQEIEELNRLGKKVIVTDHHEQLGDLPSAHAVINPKIHTTNYPFKYLAGVGVAFKLVSALAEQIETHYDFNELLKQYLDLVTIGTIADLVPLTSENRIFVSKGLQYIDERRPGMKALMDLLGLEYGEVKAGQVGFVIGPRINAAGRLASADEAVQLLTESSESAARELAKKLDKENRERQKVEQKITKEADEMINRNNLLARGPVLVVWSENWHEGVVGIVASRLLEKYYRPVIVLTRDDEPGKLKGSCRSISGFNMAEALKSCDNLLIKYGGHELAAGLKLESAHLDEFIKQMNHLAQKWLSEDDLLPSIDIDMEIPEEALTRELAEEISQLEPFGMGNPQPVIGCGHIQVASTREVGKSSEHLQIKFKNNMGVLDGIWFKGAEKAKEKNIKTGMPVQAAFIPKISTFKSKSSKGHLSLQLCDMQLPDNQANILRDCRNYSKGKTIKNLLNEKYSTVILVNNKQKRLHLQSQYPQCQVARITEHDRADLDTDNVVLVIYDLPYDPYQVRNWIVNVNPEYLYLLYNSQDKASNNKMWYATIPSENNLQIAYQLLKEQYKQTETDFISKKELQNKLEDKISYPVTNRLINKIMDIFKELKIIEYTDSYHDYVPINTKLINYQEDITTELESSLIYGEEHNRLTNLIFWEECFLKGSYSKLYMLLYNHNISPEYIKELGTY
ncbi:single-stranded-DNA-specific exonuclease RecJ [Natranaerobius thermophilus]|uniref:Single-stranded-DNA-specific exonuclease RecJ n=1 Tax=Natranaerobius thermophilus (strain ATCC BAA-1301 / DSM 18059 / JW/NM-WN-LF) TaxID=457570 RepID=B2A2F5_NATTJ|nr:single-stranded-DNA-specific exonuclease RecJ [Natranaerobius thermophilus]ACB84870.1 single-stranded-DNA-specific exonuclease RecJ [Natranaerobius thermophilus JW/NM-WN-LF]